MTTSEEIVVIDDVEDRDVPLPHWLKIGGITLYSTDKKDVLEGKWLSDAHINALQFLLKRQFPSINGLKPPSQLLSILCLWDLLKFSM